MRSSSHRFLEPGNPVPRPQRAPTHLGMIIGLVLGFVVALSTAHAQWQIARPGKLYQFPADHRSHPGFQTEWWYFTGNLRTSEGKDFGYQVTWFRQGLRPPGVLIPTRSRFIVEDLHFVHLAISDLTKKRHHFAQVLRRGSHGEAGTATKADAMDTPLVWAGPCTLQMTKAGGFRIMAEDDKATMALNLHLRPTREPIFHGSDGVSRKGPGPSNASHYYSFTRLETSGSLRVEGSEPVIVDGTSWLDREWSTSALGENQVGWDWFALRLEDGSDLMIYQMRQQDGSADPFSSGTLRKPDGSRIHLSSEAFQLQPGDTWKSRRSGGTYPIKWRISLPAQQLDLRVSATIKNQEVVLFPVTYWEGSVKVDGTLKGEGYMELTGYAGEVPMH
jgi:predicted secreted hydrolase